ncbi:NPCBM/NEW2 domain-containing protein [Bythopirellula goksoeyrii]|uniref:NPCBM/NEW2 domain protein n=1 Tax=Bythopirellula goksoeyrii TaxID=1400387 RepID=A0A5B9Q972_9BACT|nr:NPCBM/NEW2 domain-containing protein [Bythopirellula goksoeyrii]QEG35574.1 NPCBM/NEW2 domain protein [Bythopirellula goksoeyrii]
MHKIVRHRGFLTGLFILAWSNLAICVEPTMVTISTLDGLKQAGELIEWTTQSVSFKDADQLAKFSPQELLRIEFQTSRRKATASDISVELIDGSRIPATTFVVIGHEATLETPLSAVPLTVPTAQIRFVEFPQSRRPTESWQSKWEQKEFTGDVLVLLKKSSAEVDFLTGVINDITDSQVDFTWEGETIPVKLSKVAALTFYHAQSEEIAEPLCWLELSSGSRLPAAKIERNGENLQVTTTSGILLEVRLNEIAAADYSVGKLAYLSDMQPLREKWTPLIELPTSDNQLGRLGMPRRDSSFEGSPLTLAWPVEDDAEGITLKTYPKGLALRSRTEMEYRLPREMRRFVASAGIDPETASQGNILLTITADRETLLESSIDGNQGPLNIDLDIAGKQKLQILVDYGDNLDLGDRLHLVEARLIK